MRWLLSYGRGTQDIERVTLRIKANSSGDVYLPTAWYSTEWTQNCPYNWYVSIDWWADTIYSGTGSSSGAIRVGYWLKPWTIHTVTIKPVIDDFLWCRALGYKGSTHAPYLINIISDKSYKWWAVNNIFSWDYYKAYQYQWCTNLLNTDDELLPNTLEIIGNDYRAYEYEWCTSLKNNAEEKILKSVKSIWDNYRACQYQNCTSIERIWIRAINRASVGNNYRQNIFNWASSSAHPANITIEGWICEGGSWWLADSKVKTIKVYSWLVNDYKALLTWITSTKISANPIWDTNDYEYIEYIALADSNGEIRIPIGWFSTAGEQDCSYDWNISIDWWAAESYSWTGSDTYFSIGSWLTEGSEHRIIIKPNTVSFWWGRAFWYFGTWAEEYIKEFIHDSFKCFWATTTSTGDYYKFNAFRNCTNLINTYEKLPTTVNTIGLNFMRRCYEWCTSLTSAFWEVLHYGSTIADNYRYQCYKDCTSLAVHQWMAWYTWWNYPTNYKDQYFSWAWNNISVYVSRLETLYSPNVAGSDYYWGWTQTVATITRAWRYLLTWTLTGTSSNTWFDIVVYKNSTSVYSDTAPDPWSKSISVSINCSVWDVIQIRKWTEQRYWYISGLKLNFCNNIMELNNNVLNWVYVYSDELGRYTNNNAWWDISSSKFKVYYYDYKPVPTRDINKYTTLVWTYTNTGEWWSDSSSNRYTPAQWNSYERGIALYNSFSYDVFLSWSCSRSSWVVWAMLYRALWQPWGNTLTNIQSWMRTYFWNPNYDGNLKAAFTDYKWNALAACWIQRSSWWGYYSQRVFEGWRWTIYIDWDYSSWNTAVSASRDGRYTFFNNRKYYYSTKWWNSPTQVGTYSWDYTNIDFSDDGMTAYLSTWFWNITQYNLSAPWDLNNITSTWKTFNVGSSCNWCFSADKKYLFLWNWTLRVYQYTE